MNLAIILSIVIVTLFAMTYFTKRRFGVLGLALCAGALLSTMWTPQVTELVRSAGVELVAPPLANVVSAAIVLLPAIFLLFSGPTYYKKWQRIVGSLAFALLATSFVLVAFESQLNLDETGQQLYDFLTQNRSLIVTGAVIYALLDLLTFKAPKSKD